ncbi:MAG: BamA/TamA family outer membrane protein, partial [Thermoanaerobaculia bacterium]
NDVGRMSERWYGRLSRIFNHSFTRKPIVLYANSADFQQTTTTPELLGEGTGGFTDPIINRVVLPLTGSYAENDHVLGHEMVHVFQFDIAATLTNNRRRFNLEMMPLWIVEGMAEYLSKGRIDPLTAMWVRDATIHDRLPDLKKLTRDPRYFPYRYGEALLAYIGGRFGDDAVIRYFLAAGTSTPDAAFERALGVNSKQLFADWQESSRELYNPIVKDRPANAGTLLIAPVRKGARGTLNVGPALSPDGKYLAFLSTRAIFDIDLYLADATTGKVIRQLASASRNAHFESLRFIDSAGAWSPDSKRLAFVVFAKGDNYLGVVDVASGRVDNIRVPGVDAINHVAWSPDGHTIALSGQKTGVSDLFLYDLDSHDVRQLTSDKYADLQPAWSPDGRSIAFVSDRGADASLDQLRFTGFRISTIDIASREIKTLSLFDHAKNLNPQYAPDGKNLYFLSNPEGVADIFRYSFEDGAVGRVTHVQTGVTGITDLAPALTVASRTGEIAFSLFEDNNYNIYRLPANSAALTVATKTAPDSARAGQLPPLRGTGSAITAYLDQPQEGLPPASTTYPEVAYKPSLHLSYLGPPTIGVAVGTYGAGAGGSVSAYFSDILGEHNVGLTFQGGGSSGVGTFGDQISGEVFYLNQKHRLNWGADVTHLPYISAFTGVSQAPIIIDGKRYIADVIQQQRDINRFDDVSGLVQYPFSQTRRVEFSAGVQRQSLKSEIESLYVVNNQIVERTVDQLSNPVSLNLGHVSTAYVGDSSIFGFVSPIRGTRYRYEAQALTGSLHFETGLADYRKYIFFNPVTFAVRGLGYGRFGKDADDPRLSPLYIGQSSLVRGYDIGSIGLDECGTSRTGSPNDCPVFDRLIGSRIAVAAAEIRVPLFGTKEFGLLSGFIPTELVGFFDTGVATNSAKERQRLQALGHTEDQKAVSSVGVGARLLLSYIPIEVYYAKPFQRPGKGWVFGFNITPGW